MTTTRKVRLPRWKELAATAVPPLVVVVLALLLYDGIGERRESTAEVQSSYEAIDLLETFLLRLVDAETGQRAFLISGEDQGLAPYEGAARDVWTALAALRVHVGGHPAQRARLDTLEALVEQRFRRLEGGIALRRTSGLGAAQAAMASGRGIDLMNDVRRITGAMEAEERAGLETWLAREEQRNGTVLWILFGGSAASVVVALLVNLLLTRYARRQEGLNDELRRKNDQLQDLTEELEMQAEELQSQAAQLEETLAELEAANSELHGQSYHLEEMASELEASNDELQVANRRLEDTALEARQANRAKGDFLAAMSHELRTPLNAIAGYAELMEMGIHGPVTGEQTKALLRIRRNQEYLLSLINDILNFAKLEAGKVEVRVADVPLAETLLGLEDLIGPQVKARDIAYLCEPGDTDVRARGDQDRIQQILLNLLSNALKFTEPGGRITLFGDADAEGVRVHVRDSGCGIPQHRLAEIFDPFVQVGREETAASRQGVGLGLAISRELARSMGGDLSAVSREGEGSTFTLTLQRGQREAPESIFLRGITMGDVAGGDARDDGETPSAAEGA